MMKFKHIQVDDYNSEWPKMYEEEAKIIKNSLRSNLLELYHVGSTSIPGMSAKPVIDIIAEISDRKAAIIALEAAGYEYRGEYNIPLRLFFNKKTERDINLHVYEQGHPDIELNLLFRDYLRSHPEDIKRYIALKKKLLTKTTSFLKKANSSYSGYNLGKDKFIREILNKAGFNRLRMMCCTHYEEWNSAKKLREQYFVEKGIVDTYDWEEENPNVRHVVLYKGTVIIGYAQIDLRSNSEAIIAFMVFLKSEKDKEYDIEFHRYLHHWLSTLNFKVTVKSTPDRTL